MNSGKYKLQIGVKAMHCVSLILLLACLRVESIDYLGTQKGSLTSCGITINSTIEYDT